jgi:acyl-coenzyme A synthetase/AMP-(fatty) acid ligase
MLLARQAQETWVRSGAENGGYDADTRLLVAAPLVINAAFARSCACLRLGAAVLAPAGLDIQREDLTHVLALPLRLQQLLDELPAGYAPRRPVQAGTIGGFVPPDLRARAQQAFGLRVLSRYGTNEVCGVCEDLDASGTGLLSAGVDVRILDADGNEVPAGVTGVVAIRTCGMASGYLNDPEGSASAFRDGWFHSGDWGALVGPRLLRLAGRHDDLLNVGGLKVPAAQLEQAIRALAGVRDCAALSLNLDEGAATLGIALVADGETPRAELAARLHQAMPIPGGVVAELLWVDALPRLASGKLDRIGLLRLFKGQLSVKV